jgi:hypothetical protein
VITPVGREVTVVELGEVEILKADHAGGGMVEPSEDVEERRLARTRWPQEHDKFPPKSWRSTPANA